MRSTRPILLVEDDEIDAETVGRALKAINVKNRLDTVGNGEEALLHLKDESKHPCIILLDLNMPKMNGIEFLKIAKEDQVLRKIPVIIVTTSREERDRKETFDLGAAGYMVKPFGDIEFTEMIKVINLYWSASELPY